jgi:hypothetical protein
LGEDVMGLNVVLEGISVANSNTAEDPFGLMWRIDLNIASND